MTLIEAINSGKAFSRRGIFWRYLDGNGRIIVYENGKEISSIFHKQDILADDWITRENNNIEE